MVTTKERILGAKVVSPTPIDSSLAGAPERIAVPQETTANPSATEQGRQDDEDVGQVKSYADILAVMDSMEKKNRQTDAELEAEQKRAKRNKLFGSISDGISALANLYATTQYAPNAYDPKNGMAGKAAERYERLTKERSENDRQLLGLRMQKYGLEDAKDKDKRNWRRILTNDKIAQEKQERQAAIDQAKVARYNAMVAKDQASVDYYNAKIEALEAGAPLDNELKRAKIRKENAYAKKASRPSSGGSGAIGKYELTGPDGVKHYYPNKTMWEQGVAYYYGTDDNTTTSEQIIGDTVINSTKTTKPKTAVQQGAELHRQADAKKKKPFSNFSIHK